MNLVAEFELSYANLHNYTRHSPFTAVLIVYIVIVCVSHLSTFYSQFERRNVLRTQQLGEIFQV